MFCEKLVDKCFTLAQIFSDNGYFFVILCKYLHSTKICNNFARFSVHKHLPYDKQRFIGFKTLFADFYSISIGRTSCQFVQRKD